MQFVDGLKEANKDIISRLNKLIAANETIARMPTAGNLAVSSSQPVSDASKVMLYIARQGVVIAGYA